MRRIITERRGYEDAPLNIFAAVISSNRWPHPKQPSAGVTINKEDGRRRGILTTNHTKYTNREMGGGFNHGFRVMWSST